MHINQLINNAKIARLPSCEPCHARLSRECVFLAETETETETETERTRTTQSVSSGAEQPPSPAQWSVPLQALIKRRLLASHFPLGFWRWRGRCTGAGGVLVLGCRWLHSAEHPLRHMTPSNRCVCVPVCVCPVSVLRCMLPSDWAVSWPALGALRRCFAASGVLHATRRSASLRAELFNGVAFKALLGAPQRTSLPLSLSRSHLCCLFTSVIFITRF